MGAGRMTTPGEPNPGARLTAPGRLPLAAKRLVDVAGAAVGLVVALPTMLVIAALVRLTSKGPVLFVHRRVGRGGREFPMVKFRTLLPGTDDHLMHEDHRHHFVAADFKVRPDDPRITRVGRVLRRTSLDELPQLWNVLMGHMSLVGIRPVVRDQLAIRPEAHQQIYCAMRPGLTGLWQINGRSQRLPIERLELDEQWFRQWSFWGDVAILLRTPLAVLRPGTH